jgi:hypothetical protein
VEYNKYLFLSVLLVGSCGDSTPFNEAYWSSTGTKEDKAEEVIKEIAFTASLTTFSEEVANISGSVEININETDVVTVTNLSELPQSLMIGQRSISNQTCSEIAALYPLTPITNNTLEFKNYNYEDRGSRESLLADLNQANSSNGDSVNLAGKSYVVMAYVENLNSPVPRTTALLPVACGTLEVKSE